MAPARKEKEIERIESALLAEQTRIVVKRRRFVERVQKMRKTTDLDKLVIQAMRKTAGDERDTIENHPVLLEFIMTARYCEKLMLANDRAISLLAGASLKQRERDDALRALKNARQRTIQQVRQFIRASKAPQHTYLDRQFIGALQQRAYPRSASNAATALAARFLLTDRFCEHALVASEDIETQLAQRAVPEQQQQQQSTAKKKKTRPLPDENSEAAFGFIAIA